MESRDPVPRAPVVAAFDPEADALEPVLFGIEASGVTGAPLILVAVKQVHPLAGAAVAETDAAIERLRSRIKAHGVYDADIRVVEDSTAARGLARAADELRPELVVLGMTRRGRFGAAVLGTTAERVVHASACPVAVVPAGYERPAKGVLVVGAAFSPSREGRDALAAAAALARAGGARLRAITVLGAEHAADQSHGLMAQQQREVGEAETAAARSRRSAEAQLGDAVADVASDVDVEVDVLVGEAADALVAASAHVDLLVVGSRGLGPKRAIVLGSVSRKVVERAACPVLVLPRGATVKRDELLSDVAARAPRDA